MTRLLATALLTVLILAGLIRASDDPKPKEDIFNHRHQIGGRIGVWSNTGDPIPTMYSGPSINVETKIKDASFYFEGFFAYRLFSQAMLELSIGIVNRGTVIIEEGGRTDIGNLMLYPILVHLKLYPMAPLKNRLQPYITVGGGLFYGRQSVQFTTNVFDPRFREQSETDFNYAIGGGLDWVLSKTLALDFNAKLMSINFSRGLLTVRDYDAITVTVGIKYLYKSGGKKKEGRRRMR